MPTKNVVVTGRQAKMIDRLVSSGQYQNASEVLREGLRLVQERDREEKAKLKALRAAVQVGIDDLEAGRYVEFRDSHSLREYLRSLAEDAVRGVAEKAAAE
ncbi:MAG: type II toxin-antitoxin system ParD family antitoxin [Alphaproteobacteria bacterium]|nr:type II toxin-antitoxin system ParD family antitoxin [Alphaproteobacteria bacterium]MBV9062231.1 type II toxin-antitoxin system ParD family antitoxin [Alphaproteobacteria bacterium]